MAWTSAGITRIEAWRDPARVDAVRVAGDFRAIVRSELVPGLLRQVMGIGGTIVAATAHDELQGYAALVPTSVLSGDRWEGVPDAFEIGSIEVARLSRGRGIATALMSGLAEALPIDQLMMLARGNASHWEPGRLALSAIEYRRMLLRVLGRAGFQRWETDDPAVADDPMNFLAVRVGSSVSSASLLALCERATTGRHDPWW